MTTRLPGLLTVFLLCGLGCGVSYQANSDWISSFKLVGKSANLRPVDQGYASGGAPSLNYFFATGALFLSSSPNTMSVVASNHNLHPPGTNHMGAGDVFEGKVYGVIEHWQGCEKSNNPIYISIFDGQTLEKERDIEITGDLPEASGIAINSDAAYAIVTSYCDAHNLYVYDMTNWKLLGKIPLAIPILSIQGATYRQGFLYIAGTNGALYGLRLVDSAERLLYQSPMTGEFEGLDFQTSELRWLVNQADGSYLYSYKPVQN